MKPKIVCLFSKGEVYFQTGNKMQQDVFVKSYCLADNKVLKKYIFRIKVTVKARR